MWGSKEVRSKRSLKPSWRFWEAENQFASLLEVAACGDILRSSFDSQNGRKTLQKQMHSHFFILFSLLTWSVLSLWLLLFTHSQALIWFMYCLLCLCGRAGITGRVATGVLNKQINIQAQKPGDLKAQENMGWRIVVNTAWPANIHALTVPGMS